MILTLILATFLAFWKLGAHEIEDWDEARQGINAMEMLERGNYIDYYYADEIDTWNAKPPLLIWSVAASYSLFGYNTFALRLPPAICTILFFWLAFLFFRRYKDAVFAFATCLILMSCHAIIGEHIGRTADFDMMLVLFLLGFAYCFTGFVNFEKRWGLLGAGLFLGLAFYTKGPASFFLLPGAFLYVVVQKQLGRVLRHWTTYGGLLLFIGIAGSWIYLSTNFGTSFQNDGYVGDNAITTMVLYDTFERFFKPYEGLVTSDPFFFFGAIDIKLNVWNYLLYLGVILGGMQLFRAKASKWEFIRTPEHRLEVLSFLMVASLGTLISMSANKFGWYLAPIFPFIAAMVFSTVRFLSRLHVGVKLVFSLLFMFLLGRHFHHLNTPQAPLGAFVSKHQSAIQNAETVHMYRTTKPNLYLYLKFLNYEVRQTKDIRQIDPEKHLVFKRKKRIKGNFKFWIAL